MVQRVARKLMPALLGVIAIVGMLLADRAEGTMETVYFLIVAISLGGLIGAVRVDPDE